MSSRVALVASPSHHFRRRVFLPRQYDLRARGDDAGLLGGYLRQRLAQDRLMLQAYRRNDADLLLVECIRGVDAPAEAGLQHLDVGLRLSEGEEGHRG